MNFYKPHTQFYCGIDLHSRNIYICVIDRDQKKLVHRNLKNRDTNLFLKYVEPYKKSIVVGCESSYAWYWLADLCADNNIEFILGHALYMYPLFASAKQPEGLFSGSNSANQNLSILTAL